MLLAHRMINPVRATLEHPEVAFSRIGMHVATDKLVNAMAHGLMVPFRVTKAATTVCSYNKGAQMPPSCSRIRLFMVIGDSTNPDTHSLGH